MTEPWLSLSVIAGFGLAYFAMGKMFRFPIPGRFPDPNFELRPDEQVVRRGNESNYGRPSYRLVLIMGIIAVAAIFGR